MRFHIKRGSTIGLSGYVLVAGPFRTYRAARAARARLMALLGKEGA